MTAIPLNAQARLLFAQAPPSSDCSSSILILSHQLLMHSIPTPTGPQQGPEAAAEEAGFPRPGQRHPAHAGWAAGGERPGLGISCPGAEGLGREACDCFVYDCERRALGCTHADEHLLSGLCMQCPSALNAAPCPHPMSDTDPCPHVCRMQSTVPTWTSVCTRP